jgi:hypothetical protein
MHDAVLELWVSLILGQKMPGKDGSKRMGLVVINNVVKLANFWYYARLTDMGALRFGQNSLNKILKS